MFLTCILAILPIALVDGAQFPFGCKLYSSLNKDCPESIGRTYILEAIGMILGGLIFTFLLLKLFNSFQIVFILGTLSLISAALLYINCEII